MNKKIIQDIISNPVPERHIKVNTIDDSDSVNYRAPKRRAWASLLFVVVGAVAILGIFFVLSSTFSRVSVKVATISNDIKVDALIFLNKDGSGGGLKYDIMKFKETESAIVAVTGTKTVQKAATGKVTIYNAYSSASQKLIVGTRLETKDGKIYKIEKAVTVPGTTVSGGKTVPGSVETTVKASQVGPSYNIPPSEFTIPGLKGSSKFQKITAKSFASFSGGFSGEIKTASPADIQKVRLKLQETIRQKLTKNALVQVPTGMILYNDATIVTFSDNSVGDSALSNANGTQASLKVTGDLNAIIISKKDLISLIVSNTMPQLGKDVSVVIPDLEKIGFTLVNKDRVNLSGTESIPVKISGNLSVFRDFDEEDLKNKLIGMRRSDYQSVLKEFSAIEKAEATFRPSWAFYFPNDPSRIEIIKNF